MPLSDEDIGYIGVLTVRAARAGLSLSDYAEEYRALLGAYDKMLDDVAARSGSK